MEGGIPPLVELLEFTDTKVQRAAAGALRTLAFKNDENKNQVIGILLQIRCSTVVLIYKSYIFLANWQIVECNALPTLILMLRSEDAAIHYEAVGFYLCDKLENFFLFNELISLIGYMDFVILGWCYWKFGSLIPKYKERSSSCWSFATCYWITQVF